MSIKKIFKKSLTEQYRMDYDIFMKKVKEYLQRKNIDINSGMLQSEMKKAFESGEYPSKFVKRYMKKRR